MSLHITPVAPGHEAGTLREPGTPSHERLSSFQESAIIESLNRDHRDALTAMLKYRHQVKGVIAITCTSIDCNGLEVRASIQDEGFKKYRVEFLQVADATKASVSGEIVRLSRHAAKKVSMAIKPFAEAEITPLEAKPKPASFLRAKPVVSASGGAAAHVALGQTGKSLRRPTVIDTEGSFDQNLNVSTHLNTTANSLRSPYHGPGDVEMGDMAGVDANESSTGQSLRQRTRPSVEAPFLPLSVFMVVLVCVLGSCALAPEDMDLGPFQSVRDVFVSALGGRNVLQVVFYVAMGLQVVQAIAAGALAFNIHQSGGAIIGWFLQTLLVGAPSTYLIVAKYRRTQESLLADHNNRSSVKLRAFVAKSPHDEELKEGAAYFLRKDYDRAEEVFKRVLSRDPSNSHALNNLGLLAEVGGDNDLAKDYYKRALQADRDNTDAQYNLNSVTLSGYTSASLRV